MKSAQIAFSRSRVGSTL